MLAELFLLQRNLHLQGLGSSRVHRDFDSPSIKSRPTLQIKLDKTGHVRQVSSPPADIEPGLWTLKSGNHSYFPAVRTDKIPLLYLEPDDPAWARIARIERMEHSPAAGLLAELCDKARLSEPQLAWRSGSQKQAARIAAWPVTVGDDVHLRLHDFALGFQVFASTPTLAATELLYGIERASATTADPTLLVNLAAVIVGQLKKAKGKAQADSHIEYGAQLLFDFWSDDEPSFSLYSHAVRDAVLNALLSGKGVSTSNSDAAQVAQQGICALRGEPAALLRAAFPGWSAKPVISKSLRPFDKFGAAPCNLRYQRADSMGFDIGEATANAVVGALKTVTEEPMRGITWRPLKNGVTARNGIEQSDVLIAYPSCVLSDLQGEPLPNIVEVLGEPWAADGDEAIAQRKQFEDAAEPVCKAFDKAIGREAASQRIPPNLQILLIRQVSAGQIQIAYSAQPTLAEFNTAVEKWSQSASNLPDELRVPVQSDKANSGFALALPRLIFPERISRVLARQWIRAGTDSTAVPPPPVGMVLDLFLRRPGALPTQAVELLNLTLSRAEPLLRGVGGTFHRDQLHPARAGFLSQWKQFLKGTAKGKGKPDVGYAAAHTISLIGSLLFTMDSKASDYTRRSAFLIGKLLAMMDELHKNYCVVVRDGAVPPSLIGNSMLGRASDSPAQALAELCDRSRPYIGWAKTVATPANSAKKATRIAVFSARKLLRVAQPLCEQLGADDSLAQPMGDLDKAHLLLGYLSPVLTRDDKEDASDNETTADAKSTTTDEVHTP